MACSVLNWWRLSPLLFDAADRNLDSVEAFILVDDAFVIVATLPPSMMRFSKYSCQFVVDSSNVLRCFWCKVISNAECKAKHSSKATNQSTQTDGHHTSRPLLHRDAPKKDTEAQEQVAIHDFCLSSWNLWTAEQQHINHSRQTCAHHTTQSLST